VKAIRTKSGYGVRVPWGSTFYFLFFGIRDLGEGFRVWVSLFKAKGLGSQL
jgi:hypothetical protein